MPTHKCEHAGDWATIRQALQKRAGGNGGGRSLTIIGIVLTIIVLLSGVYFTQLSGVNARVRVIEEERIETAERLAGIEAKLDEIFRYIQGK